MRGNPPYTQTKKNQQEPTTTETYEATRSSQWWFVSVGLFHRNFIAGSESPCESLGFTACRTFIHTWRTRPIETSVVDGEPGQDLTVLGADHGQSVCELDEDLARSRRGRAVPGRRRRRARRGRAAGPRGGRRRGDGEA